MESHRTPSSQDEINSASSTPFTDNSDDNYIPSVSTASLLLSQSDTAPSSCPLYPPNFSDADIADPAAVCVVTSSSIDENDVVIAVMGLTGAGKSSFINKAAGRTAVMIGSNLNSQTRAVQAIRCPHPDGRRNVVLVDTPGFDDTNLSDTQILRIIAHWLKETYQNNIKLSGILYLHRISDTRMAGTPLRNLAVFKDLCGDSNLKNIVLVTTMWDEVENQSIGVEREEELLSEFWKDMIRFGSRTCRFQGTRESAWRIIDRLNLEGTRQRCTPLQIQREMVDRGLEFHETTAARTLLRFIVQLAGELKKGWARLRNRTHRKDIPREHSNGLWKPSTLSRSSTVRSNSSAASWSTVSTTTLPSPISPAASTTSACSVVGRQHALSVTIRVLKLTHQVADIGHIPFLRGIIGTVLHIAQIIEGMGGTHHMISQVIESSGWLLEEIAQYSVGPKLSRDMRRTLSSLQSELNNLQKIVTKISRRGSIARFFLHDADIQAVMACTASIKAVYDKLGVKLAMENSHAIARLEDQVTVLLQGAASRQCECGMSIVPREAQEN